MKISVVIPTYNEEERLGECLDAIMKGTLLPDEIIVSDGMSTDRTVEIAQGYELVKVVPNPKKHAAGGRNEGIKVATGELIAFIDADCIAHPDWLFEISKAFSTDDIDGCGTYIEPCPTDNRCEKFWGHLSLQLLMSYGDEPYYVAHKSLNEAFITASCAYKKELLDKLGGFSDYFANNAEDVDLCWRALDSGARLKYIPDAKICAHSPTTIQGIKRKSFRNGVSSSKLQKVYSSRRVSIDKYLYKALLHNLLGILKKEEYADLFVIELLWHLAGKYYGSLKYGVINI